jgi:hypothetical protein
MISLFSYWKFYIFRLAVSERYNLVTVMNWTSKSPYYEQDGYNGLISPVEY